MSRVIYFFPPVRWNALAYHHQQLTALIPELEDSPCLQRKTRAGDYQDSQLELRNVKRDLRIQDQKFILHTPQVLVIRHSYSLDYFLHVSCFAY